MNEKKVPLLSKGLRKEIKEYINERDKDQEEGIELILKGLLEL